MAVNQIGTTVSRKEITFKPGEKEASFEVMVTNDSDRLANFQLELLAAGTDSNQKADWYRIWPEVSTKKPAGDRTEFHVDILDTPVPGFVGLMNLTVRVFSLDLGEEDREMLRLTVERGTGTIVMKLELPVKEFRVNPGERIEIPVRVSNPSQLSADVVLRFLRLNTEWLIDGSERRWQVSAGKQVETTFSCQIPPGSEAASKVYPFTIEVVHSQGPPSVADGSLEVFPTGMVDFSCNPTQQQIPAKRAWLPGRPSGSGTYEILFQNQSNLDQQVSIEVKAEDRRKYTLEIIPELTDLNHGESSQVQLAVKVRRHWLGLAKKLLIEVAPVLSDKRLGNTNPATKTLKLTVFPVIPTWLMVGSGLLLLWLAWWLSWLNPQNPFFGHQSKVNSVQFNGVGERVISASNDQSAIAWRVSGFFMPLANQEIGRIGNAGKAVRIVRYKPVNNDEIALGLENGDILLWNLLIKNKNKIEPFFFQKDDRVLALQFSLDSRHLFSGHGSGFVLQWDIRSTSAATQARQQPSAKKKFDFAVYALALVGKHHRNLAVAGRFNQLVLWNPEDDSVIKLPYRQGGQDDYIFSIHASALKPNLLATADNQGYITLWNLEKCLELGKPCEILDRWSDGHGGQAVKAVALSNKGCYLASGGHDGRMMIWPLARSGRRASEFPKGIEVGQSYLNEKINSIDVKVVDRHILIASGSDDTQVRVERLERLPQVGCDTL